MAPPSEVIDCIKRAISTDFACITWQGTEYYVAYRNLTLPGNAPIPLKYEFAILGDLAANLNIKNKFPEFPKKSQCPSRQVL